jgi:predicted RNA-binding Zn-ribbon protein involved in translation (DUF1610 family)
MKQINDFLRKCPTCGKEMMYKTKTTLKKASDKNTNCKTCNKIGTNNPFYGKNHNESTIDKIRESNKNNITKYQSDEFRNKISEINKGYKNPMFGKTFYQCWVDKYGEDISNEKMIEIKRKHSFNNSGEKNNMYGKPSPNGSGNGWSGWYKDFFFKSLKELSFIIYMEDNEIEYESAERKKFKIPYIDFNDRLRNYYPDFFLPKEKLIVECKPTHLFNSIEVLNKRKAAELFCKENGYEYRIIDPIKLSDKDILEVYKKGTLKFIDRYDVKFRERHSL